MNIRVFCDDLLKIYQEMSASFSAAQKQYNLQCPSDCGKCCHNPEIEATVLEMLPLALYIHDQELVDTYLDKIELSMKTNQLCVGIELNRCALYPYRPSLCRMFAVNGQQDKYQKTRASICKVLKEIYPQDALEIINFPENHNLPSVQFWSNQLLTLDPELLSRPMKINHALKIAIEKVEMHLIYESSQNVR